MFTQGKPEKIKIKINFSDELGTEAQNIFKRAFVSILKKHDKFHNGIVTAEKFCSSIRETDEYLREEDNIWGVIVESKDKCNVTSPAVVSIMNLVQITQDKYVNCKPLYLDVERIESTILVKNPYNESTVMVAQIQRTNLERDHVKYSVRCPKMFLEDLYPPALESANRYSNKNRHECIFNIEKTKYSKEEPNKPPSLRALPSDKLDDFRKLYAMWNKCMLSDEDFIMHMKKDIGIKKIPREFLLQVANKGPSRTLSFKDAICSLFINDVDSLRKYRPDHLVPQPGRIKLEKVFNPITHENISDKNTQKILKSCGKGYGKILADINSLNDQAFLDFKSQGRRNKPNSTPEEILKNSLEANSSPKTQIPNNSFTFILQESPDHYKQSKFDFLINDFDSEDERARDKGKILTNYHRITVTMPDTLQTQLKRCAAGETSGNAIREYLKFYGIPISVNMDTLLRRSDEDGSVSFTSLMKEAYHSIKNMQTIN
ncbi:Pfa MAL6P1.309 like protein [Cryptosporidium felis]|nr:Pfa MAL6P1.309 like protein [Cryptosporidium felis]